MLIWYQQLTRRLVNDATFARVNDFDLQDYINIARRQIAGAAECVPAQGTLAVNPNQQQYPFSAIQFPAGVMPVNLRTLTWGVAGLPGAKQMYAYPWARFNSFILAQPVPAAGQPRYWAQYGQGTDGTIYVNKLDGDYTLNVDAIGLPVDLIDDDTPEALPLLWQDAVPFWAAAYTYLQFQQGEEADRMLQRFQMMMGKATGAATPSVQPGSFAGGGDPFLANRLGIQRQGQQAQRQPIVAPRGTGPEV